MEFFSHMPVLRAKGEKMKKYQKRIALDYVELLSQTQDAIKQLLEDGNMEVVADLLQQCQEAAVQVGTLIEEAEGEGFATVKLLEEYCELTFRMYTSVMQSSSFDVDDIYEQLKRKLDQIQNSVQTDIKDRLEAVFLPYEVSMWDSLESVWMTADADEICDAYVIPIPYLDSENVYYKGDQFPDYVPITNYKEFDFSVHRPDMVFIHNPYDDRNYVTSVHPFFYSSNLKQYTDMLVYIPYYSTTGGMSEAQDKCPAYYHVDYIITQAEKYRKYFDPALPQEKLAPLGSPKFDRVMRLCNNPPEPPEAWKEKMSGKKVYFYNTSIGGLLGNSGSFLEKMKYVFRCFESRTDVCLLWRPHPLLETSMNVVQEEYRAAYHELKKEFQDKDLGIYDDTPDIADTIALCDACIGDAGTSVTSLFGMAGKPLFILNNDIHSAPRTDDWRGGIIRGFSAYGSHEWLVTQGNKLYHSENGDYQYRYCLDLSKYAYGNYYQQVLTVHGKHYVCPANAQDIVVISNGGIERRIRLDVWMEQAGAFYGSISCGGYLFLLPNSYPAIVRYDIQKDEIRYFREHLDIFTAEVQGEKRVGGYCVQDEVLYIASNHDNQVLALNAVTGREEVMRVPAEHLQGSQALVSDGGELWFLPYEGAVITRWNPLTGEAHEYCHCPEELRCVHPIRRYECMERPFGWAAFYKDNVYLSPCWANMYIRLDKNSGEMVEWKPPFEEPEAIKSDYYLSWAKSGFVRPTGKSKGSEWLLFSCYDRKLYAVDLETNDYREIEVGFDLEELRENEPGFWEDSQWLMYACEENAFNSLEDFLDGNITGNAFDRERQMRAFCGIAANHDGTSGEKIYEFVKGKLQERQEELT